MAVYSEYAAEIKVATVNEVAVVYFDNRFANWNPPELQEQIRAEK